MLTLSGWVDEWIQEQYPDSLFYTDSSGEVYVGLGIGEDGAPLT